MRVRSESREISPVYELDMAFNYTIDPVSGVDSPYPDDATGELYVKAAEQIVSKIGVTKGYCLVYGCEKGQLAFELAKRTELSIVCVDEDSQRISEVQKLLHKAGVYGKKITARQGGLCEWSKSPIYSVR